MIGIVIPAHDEQELIGAAVAAAHRAMDHRAPAGFGETLLRMRSALIPIAA